MTDDIVKRLRKLADDNLDPGNALVREVAAEIERLQAIEQAADKAYRYHMLGYKDPTEFNANVMLDLMNELGAAL